MTDASEAYIFYFYNVVKVLISMDTILITDPVIYCVCHSIDRQQHSRVNSKVVFLHCDKIKAVFSGVDRRGRIVCCYNDIRSLQHNYHNFSTIIQWYIQVS